MEARSQSTQLPPVRRTRRRDWGRVVCRILCVFFALAGLVPVGVGLLVRTTWARTEGTRQTQRLAANFGIAARYELEFRIWPLSVSVGDLRVEASDGGTPFLTAQRVTARPKIFGLLAGKVVIDQLEVDKPRARIVLADGKLKNLKLDLPETPKSEGPTKPPFSVVSLSEADVDLTIDATHVEGQGIDADVTTDDDGEGGTAFEVAIRAAVARAKIVRDVPAKGGAAATTAVDEDTLCQLDGRARIEPKRIVVRRLSAHGAVDMDPAEGTFLGCDLPKTDYRYAQVELGHFTVTLPRPPARYPNLEGHAKVRGPIPLVSRFVEGTPVLEGWVMADAELRFTPQTPIPDLVGRLEIHDIRVARFNFAKNVVSELSVQRGVVAASLTRLDIAGSTTEIRDIEVRPFEIGTPVHVGRLDVKDVNFTTLLHDFRIHPRPFVAWDVRELHLTDLHGTAEPLGMIGDLTGKTYDFAVYDRPVQDPAKARIIGVREAALNGKVAIRPKMLEFQSMTVTTQKSIAQGVLVGIGYHEELKVEVPSSKIDLAELSPLGSVPMSGIAEPKVVISGTAGDPQLAGDVAVKELVIGDIPFGNVTQGHVVADIGKLGLDLSDVHAQKGKSDYEMGTGHLDFNKPVNMKIDGQVTSKNFNVRDLFSMFHLDDDPRLAEIDGTLESSARIHLVLGGPEDACGGGFLSVAASTNARDLNLLGEHFDEGNADFEYRWVDRLAGIEGAEIDIRSLSLTKVKKPGRAPMGSVLGSIGIRRGGDMRGSLVVQGFPLARTDLLGPAAKTVEGAVSGVAQLGGKLDAFDITADVNLTPIRILGAPFGGSDVHVRMNQKAPSERPIGRTACGAPIPALFNKDAYLKDTSSQGEYQVSGSLFGGQIQVDDVVVTRQKAPVIKGKVTLDRFDLGPLAKILTPPDEATAQANQGAAAAGGEISGEVVIDKIPLQDLGHSVARFSPKVVRMSRGGQRIELRKTEAVLVLDNDTLTVPKMIFDLATPSHLKGAVAVDGTVRKITHRPELGLRAELSPIDLGILVGVIPQMTRAVGTLNGSVKITGTPAEPEFGGRIQVRGGEFAIKGLPGGINSFELDAEADGNEARITRAVGHFLGGEVSATARMPLKGGQLGVGRATVTGRQLFVQPVDGVRATLDADLELTLNPNASSPQGRLPFVGGEINITQFEYTRPVTLDLTGFRGGAKRTVVEAYDPSADAIAFGVNVRSRAPLQIHNNLVDAKLAIDQRGILVSGTNQRVGLRGELGTLPGGRFRVFANDFEVQKGTIRFEDPTRIAPHVDITGVTEYQRYSNTVTSPGTSTNTTGGAGATSGSISSGGRGGGLWRITLHAFGDTEDLHVDMTSDPALSREDIFFLLTIGLTRAEVDQVSAGSVYASAAFEAIGTVSGADRAVKQVIPVIDDFRFGSAYSPRTGRTEPQVTLGRRLTESVRANVATGLTEDRQLRSNVEWRLSRPLSVQASYDNISTVSSGSVGNFGLDFRWRVEFN